MQLATLKVLGYAGNQNLMYSCAIRMPGSKGLINWPGSSTFTCVMHNNMRNPHAGIADTFCCKVIKPLVLAEAWSIAYHCMHCKLSVALEDELVLQNLLECLLGMGMLWQAIRAGVPLGLQASRNIDMRVLHTLCMLLLARDAF